MSPVKQRTVSELGALEQIAEATRTARPLAGVVELLIDQVAQVLTIDAAAVWLRSATDDLWYIGGSRGLTWRASEVRFDAGEALQSRIVDEGEIVTDLASAGFRRLYPEHEAIRGALYAPIAIAGRRVGLLALYRESEQPFTSEDLRFARTVGAQAGIVVSFAALEARGERQAAIEERARIGADLHDGILQILSAVRVYAADLNEELSAEAGSPDASRIERLRELVGEIEACVDTGSEEIATAISRLRRPDAGVDIVRSLELARERLEEAGIATELAHEGDELPAEVTEALAWIVREAVSNILRHSHATKASIELRATGPVLELLISDNGVGEGFGAASPIDPERVPVGSGGDIHLGRELMRERAAQMGGTLTIDAGPDGVRVRVRVPVIEPPAERGTARMRA